jgi:hypothetical protein
MALVAAARMVGFVLLEARELSAHGVERRCARIESSRALDSSTDSLLPLCGSVGLVVSW